MNRRKKHLFNFECCSCGVVALQIVSVDAKNATRQATRKGWVINNFVGEQCPSCVQFDFEEKCAAVMGR